VVFSHGKNLQKPPGHPSTGSIVRHRAVGPRRVFFLSLLSRDHWNDLAPNGNQPESAVIYGDLLVICGDLLLFYGDLW